MLGGLKPKQIIAIGESQSAGRLVTYIDAVHPLVDVYDGFLVHSRMGGGSPLSQAPQPSVPSRPRRPSATTSACPCSCSKPRPTSPSAT